MGYSENLKDCRVLIKDAVTGQLLADTQITDYDPQKKILKIRPSSLTVKKAELKNGPISALIFGENGLYEYSGALRVALIANEIEVSLSGGREKESRSNSRYDILVRGKAEAIVLENQKVFLRNPIEIVTKNISGNGVLIQAMAGSFEAGDCLQLMMEINGRKIRGDYKVLRKQNCNIWTEEYGCQKVDLKRER